jgi:predicted flap endonuclease-1-like 5' DNA nuclease
MWFLTIESIALLAVATTLGLFAGWLVWGGKPPSPAVAASSAVPTESVASTGVADLVLDHSEAGWADHDELVRSGANRFDAGPFETDPFDADFSSVTMPRSSLLSGNRGDGARLSAEEIDPGAFEALVEQELGSESATDRAVETNSETGAQLEARTADLPAISVERPQSTTNASSKFVTDTAQLRIAELQTELHDLSDRLSEREADVARLKAKLRKAVVEIERRTALAQTARAELIDEHHRVVQGLANASVAPVNVNASALEHDDFAPSGTRFTSAEIDDLIQAKTASLLIQTSQLERRTALIQSRAEEAETRVVALKAEAAQYQAEAESTLAKAQHDAANRILALEVDLASARQRTNVATQELVGFASEVSAIRDTNAKHLQSVHETMRDLELRLDTTKAALAGRSLPKSPISSVVPDNFADRPTLLGLPGMTPKLIDSLSELGVASLEDVAGWTSEDVARIQSWLPEDPAIVERNGWVAAAQEALDRASIVTEA